MPTEHTISRYADIQLALADTALVPALVAPPVQHGPPGTMPWLRAAVSRFADGETHARRRALIEAELARLDPDALRTAAAHAEPQLDVRLRVVRTLADAMGLAEPDRVAAAVVRVAAVYFGGDDPAADEAVAWLLDHVPAPDAEAAANRICLLVQACDATATLVAHAGHHAGAAAAVLRETLRHDPPARIIRRVAARDTRVADTDIAAGELVLLDIAAANRDPSVFDAPNLFDVDRDGAPALSFGAGIRPCPAADHALALAAGLLQSVPDAGGAP